MNIRRNHLTRKADGKTRPPSFVFSISSVCVRAMHRGATDELLDEAYGMIRTPGLQVRTRTIFILLALIGLIVYFNALRTPFHFDDTYYLKENLGIKSASVFWDRYAANVTSLFRARPFLLLTFLVNYKLGGLDTFGYHLFNLFIHIGNAFLLYVLLQRYVDPDNKGYSLKSLLASLLFLIHPVNTESVTYISSRSSELSAFFAFLSMYCFFRSTEQKFLIGEYSLSIVFFLLGLMTKEAAIVLPGLLLLVDYFFISKGAERFRTRLKYHLPILLTLAALFMVYFSLFTMKPDGAERPWLTHILTELKVFAQYLRLLVVPVGLNIDHDVRPSNVADIPVVFSTVVLAFLLAAAIYYRKKRPFISLPIGWFFLCLAPFLFVRLNDYMAERWIYLASAGFCIGLAELLMVAANSYRETAMVLASAVVLLFGSLTVARNHVYSSPILLWEDAAKKSPEKYRPYLNLSNAYMENGDSARAIENAGTAVMLWKQQGLTNSDIVLAHINVAAAMGPDSIKAREMLDAVKIEASRYPEYYGELGAVHMNEKDYKKAIDAFKKGLALSPQSASFLFLIGQCYEQLAQNKQAREYYIRATGVIPQTAQEYMAQGEAFSSLGDYQKAATSFHEAVRTDPLDVSMRIYYGTILLNNGYFDNAFKEFSTAAMLAPRQALAYKGMGLVMLAKGENGRAKSYFDKALDMLTSDSPEKKIVQDLREKTLVR